jgi:hypothetical protein
MTDKKESGKNAEIRKAYRSDRKDRPAHLLDADEQRQVERLRRSVVEAVMAGEGQRALDTLKEIGCGVDSPEYKAVIALLYPASKKK